MSAVIAYITEEVTRQGHDVTVLDGIERVGWMLNAWAYALRCTDKPQVNDAILLGQLIEPAKNQNGLRTGNVCVGPQRCPEWQGIGRQLGLLFDARDTLTPIEFYKEFEQIHPFVDGNGRTGKVLLNLLNGTLLQPIFPPSDLFGRPICNP